MMIRTFFLTSAQQPGNRKREGGCWDPSSWWELAGTKQWKTLARVRVRALRKGLLAYLPSLPLGHEEERRITVTLGFWLGLDWLS